MLVGAREKEHFSEQLEGGVEMAMAEARRNDRVPCDGVAVGEEIKEFEGLVQGFGLGTGREEEVGVDSFRMG